MTEALKWNQDSFSKRLRELASSAPPVTELPGADPVQRGYREAASVVFDFDPKTLRPHGVEETKPGAFSVVLGDSEPVVGADENWTLRPEIRALTLRRLVEEGKLEEVVASADVSEDDPFHTVLARIAKGEPIELRERSEPELSCALELAKLVGAKTLDLPPEDEIRRELGRSRLLAPMRHVGGDHFYGRESELEDLRNYVGVANPKTVTGKIFRKVRDVLDLRERPPLMIFGPGGMGKSALMSRFILEHADLEEDRRFPFVYLDFDRPSIAAREPLTLLAEALLQLGVQYPSVEPRCTQLREELRELVAWAFGQRQYAEAGLEAIEAVRSRSSSGGERELFVAGLAKIFEEIATANQPLLLILDTFEEVQYHSRPDIPELFHFLQVLQEQIPRLRVVLAGRTRETSRQIKPLPLEPLDDKDARAMLVGQGLPNDVAKRIVGKLGGNPLTLRLAVSVYERDGLSADELSDLDGVAKFWRSVDDERVQGELYRRFLQHIPDKAVRDMAHPGLTLRRLTPDLILNVLAEPCGLPVTTAEEARDLFNRLARHDTLVSWEGNAIVHRSDVRRIMLDLLERTERDKVDAIHLGAVNHYEVFDDPVSRAEEIYHRYCLEHEEDLIEERWIEGIEDSLRTAIGEVPESVRSHLAARTGGEELSDEDWDEAPLSDWERFTARRARQLTEHARYEEALDLLGRRDERTPTSPLHNLEVVALARLGRLQEAWELGTKALAADGWSLARDRELELRRSLGSVARRQGDYGAAHEHLLLAALLAIDIGDVQRGIDSILLALESVRAVGGEEDEETRSALATLASKASTRQIVASPALFGLVANELHTTDPELAESLRVRLEEGGGIKRSKQPRERKLQFGGSEAKQLSELMAELFSVDELERFLIEHLDERLANISGGGSLRSLVYEVIQHFGRRGRTLDLIRALRQIKPNDPWLAKLQSDLED